MNYAAMCIEYNTPMDSYFMAFSPGADLQSLVRLGVYVTSPTRLLSTDRNSPFSWNSRRPFPKFSDESDLQKYFFASIPVPPIAVFPASSYWKTVLSGQDSCINMKFPGKPLIGAGKFEFGEYGIPFVLYEMDIEYFEAGRKDTEVPDVDYDPAVTNSIGYVSVPTIVYKVVRVNHIAPITTEEQLRARGLQLENHVITLLK